MIAAWRSGLVGARTLLLEKTSRLGTKILMSGGGKCNITHSGNTEDVLSAFTAEEARFLRPSSYLFGNKEIISLLGKHGVEVYTREDGRVFPTSGNAKQVVDALSECLREAHVAVKKNCAVTGLQSADGEIFGVCSGDEIFGAKAVVIAVGGSSYPTSGTTGDGWKWAQSLGHKIAPVRAALAPIYLVEPAALAGVALRDVTLKAKTEASKTIKRRGDLLFTHKGISGPVTLSISESVAEIMPGGEVRLSVDLIPDEPPEATDLRLIETSRLSPNRSVVSLLPAGLPERVGSTLLAAAGLDPVTSLASLKAVDRKRLTGMLRNWDIGAVKAVPLEKGECVAGGVTLAEVNPRSLESSMVRGLFFCGELLDIAGPVGGYNLFAAFATGFLAGESAAKRAISP